MKYESREQVIGRICSDESSFRARQATEALFSSSFDGWNGVSSLPTGLRVRLAEEVSWNVFRPVATLPNKRGDTWKALLETADGARIETVLMRNARSQFTVCVSTQVGCAMACRFCATGRMGFSRNLSEDEIVDQVRFLRDYIREKGLDGEVTNIVFMGMGEPLANYDNVKTALRTFTERMGVGPTRITVSTVGLVPILEKLLEDPEWPPVRLAVSLHSADPVTRKAIMPTSYDDFLDKLAGWTGKYFGKFSEKRRHLTFEYILLSGVNDTEEHVRALIRFVRRIGKVRINLIPYNHTDAEFRKPSEADVERFRKLLTDAGVTVTRRRTMGDDIAAACGQLAATT